MNHEIKHDIDVEAARRKCREPVDLEELWLCRDLCCRHDDGIKSFDVSHLENSSVVVCRLDQFGCIRNCGGDRLFHQNVDPMRKQIDTDTRVVDSRNSETDRVDLAEKLAVVGQR